MIYLGSEVKNKVKRISLKSIMWAACSSVQNCLQTEETGGQSKNKNRTCTVVLRKTLPELISS